MLFTRLRQVPSRQLLVQVLYSLSTIASMVMLYTGLGILSNSESPVVVVLSGSMEPAFKRGDILFLTNPIERTYKPGDIIVYKIPGSPIPIVHRVLEIHEHYPIKSLAPEVAPRSYSSKPYLAQPDNERFQLMLTKGDNNPVDDIELYNGLEWIQPKHVIGKVQGFLPYVGYISIAMNDAPKLKYIIFAVLSIFSLL